MSGKTLKQLHKTEWHAWRNMKARCYNKNLPNYHRYGGRGITVCEEWLGKEGFENFLHSMGLKPSPDLTLDRIDNNGNYEPSNCRWADVKAQSNNQEKNIVLIYKGKSLTLAQWAEKLGMTYEQIRARYRYGWDANSIIETPKNKYHKERRNGSKSRLLTYNGKTMNLAQWARELGTGYEVLRTRVRNGWDDKAVLSTPARKSKLYSRDKS